MHSPTSDKIIGKTMKIVNIIFNRHDNVSTVMNSFISFISHEKRRSVILVKVSLSGFVVVF